MIKSFLVLCFGLFSLGACCCGVPPTEPGQRVHAVRLSGWYYLLVSDEPVPAQGGPVLGPEHARVSRLVPCGDGVIHYGNGRVEDPCALQPGESTLLPAGTTLHPRDNIPAGQRLAAVHGGRLLTFVVHFPPD